MSDDVDNQALIEELQSSNSCNKCGKNPAYLYLNGYRVKWGLESMPFEKLMRVQKLCWKCSCKQRRPGIPTPSGKWRGGTCRG